MTVAPRARILSIGTEILFGEIVDTNAAFLAAEMGSLGAVLTGTRQLGDARKEIAAAFADALRQVDLVVATGGLGPTHDDLTREGLADALGEPLTEDPALRDRLVERFGGAGRMPASNLRQALRVPSAVALENPIGSAPGWWTEHDARVAVLMPGVPAEMRRMWREQVVPRLVNRFALAPLRTRTVKTFGIGESAVVEKLGDMLERPGEGVDAGIYARDDGVHLRFSTRADGDLLEPPVAMAIAVLGDDVYGTGVDTLPGVALRVLAAAGCATLASIETGTEGTLGAILAGHLATGGEARFVGGTLAIVGQPAGRAPAADAVLAVTLGAPGALGRSRVGVRLQARAGIAGIGFGERMTQIHGSGVQRLRRAAFAALDQVRRA
jgi:molybdenum cofactor synthesis domain-containing protein